MLPFRAELEERSCTNTASLVEVEVLPHEGGWVLGREKEPDLREFRYWLEKRGIKREFVERENGELEIHFYTKGLGRYWKLRKVFRFRPAVPSETL